MLNEVSRIVYNSPYKGGVKEIPSPLVGEGRGEGELVANGKQHIDF